MAVAIPLIAAAVVAGAQMYSSERQNSAQRSASRNANNAQSQYMKRYAQSQQQYRNYLEGLGANLTSTSNSRPYVTDEYSPMVDAARGILQRRLNGGTGLPAGYASTGVQAINQSFAGQEAELRNQAARRGLSADTMLLGAPSERARLGQLASFRANLPLQARSMQNEDLGLAQQLASLFGRGTITTSTSPNILPFEAFSAVPPGNLANPQAQYATPAGLGYAQGAASLATAVGEMYGNGAFSSNPSQAQITQQYLQNNPGTVVTTA